MPRKTSLSFDEKYLKEAIKEAKKAAGKTGKNPNVGAIIVKNNQIIARGRTQGYGGNHAEIEALKQAGTNATGATLYVSLEPCCHHGKTPPCTKAIIVAGIKRLVCGILDPNPPVAGKGIAELRQAGIEVKCGLLEDEIRRVNEVYLCNIEHKRPFVTLKMALSLDARFAAEDGSSQWITNEKARRHVHLMRSKSMAILSSSKTINADDALMNVRGIKGASQPLRLVLDSRLLLSPTGRFAQSAFRYPSLVFYSEENPARAKALQEMGIELYPVKAGLDLQEILGVLYHEKGISSVFLEVGSRLASAFWKAGLIDKYLFYYGNLILGGANSVLKESAALNIAQATRLKQLSYKSFGDSFLISAYPKANYL